MRPMESLRSSQPGGSIYMARYNSTQLARMLVEVECHGTLEASLARMVAIRLE